jgi:hypothetical protein
MHVIKLWGLAFQRSFTNILSVNDANFGYKYVRQILLFYLWNCIATNFCFTFTKMSEQTIFPLLNFLSYKTQKDYLQKAAYPLF